MKKRAWISGHSRGIGSALYQLLESQGWNVGGGSRSTGVDITDLASVEASIDEFVSTHGGLDVVVHCAAMLGPRAELSDVSTEEMRTVLDVNVLGTFNVIKAAGPRFSGAGQLLLLSSSVGRRGRAGWGPYSASKHALEGLADTIAEEMPQVRVLSLNPGGTATDMRAEAYPDEDPKTLPTAEEIAKVIFDLMNDASHKSGSKLDCRDFL